MDDFCLVKHARLFSKENMHKNTSSKDFQDASSEFQEFKGGKEFSASFMTGYGVLSFGTLPLASLFWSALLVSWSKIPGSRGMEVPDSAKERQERKKEGWRLKIMSTIFILASMLLSSHFCIEIWSRNYFFLIHLPAVSILNWPILARCISISMIVWLFHPQYIPIPNYSNNM